MTLDTSVCSYSSYWSSCNDTLMVCSDGGSLLYLDELRRIRSFVLLCPCF